MSDQEKDPVVTSSLSKSLFIWLAVLVLSMIWGLYDEVYGIRPWKGYQAQFQKLYASYIKSLRAPEGQRETQIMASPQYKQLDSDMKAAEQAALPEAGKIKQQVDALTAQISALNDPFQEVRSHIGALTYQTEIASESSKAGLRKQIDDLKAESHTVKLPDGPKEMKFPEMDATLQDWKKQKAILLQKNVEV